MYEEVLRERLNRLYKDLTFTGKEAVALVNFINTSIDDKHTMIRDVYYRDRAPVKVLNPAFTGSGGNYDIEGELINISEGYDRFLKKVGYKTSSVLDRHGRALDLLLSILALPDPYSRLLYLHFFKCLTIAEVSEIMFMSKSSCYRRVERGIHLLHESIEKNENK